MWTAIHNDTGGRVDAQMFPLNNSVTGSDPAALKLLMAGEIQEVIELKPPRYFPLI